MIESRLKLTFMALGLAVAMLLAGPQQALAQDDSAEAMEEKADEMKQEMAEEAEEAADEAEEAAEEATEETAFGEEIVVTGSRAQPRSVTESMVPVDVLTAEEFVRQGDTDVSNLLRTLVPSYNVNSQPISDAATVVRPANLRNLAPDHTLVLVNGKRRHRAAVIYWLGNGVADGAQGPDISAIPGIALRQVEVLRDGASAQYGSDAIAGVMNFMLKDDSSGGSIELRTGGYQEGDGDLFTIAGNVGLPWGENGFINLSGEFGAQDPTSRSVQRDDAALLLSVGNSAVADPAQIWGTPETEDDLKLWGNFGYLFDTGQQFYGHANYVTKTVTGGFYYRNPNTRGSVFSADGGETLLIGDLIDAQDGVLDGSAGCPVVTVTGGVPDPTALAAVFNDPNCFSFQEIFPGGFTPQFGGDLEDTSVVAGVRGQMANGLAWDASASIGSSEVDFFISNTVNASLGPDTPTTFDPGLYKQEELNLNFDVSYALNDMTNLAGGIEWREEEFTIGIGQLESFQIGPLAAQGFSAASNGFPGFGDIAAGSWSRSNFAVYGDVEWSGDGWDLRYWRLVSRTSTTSEPRPTPRSPVTIAFNEVFSGSSQRSAPVFGRRRRVSRTPSTCQPSSIWSRWSWSTTAPSRSSSAGRPAPRWSSRSIAEESVNSRAR